MSGDDRAMGGTDGLRVVLRHRVGGFTLDAAFTAPPGLTVVFGPSGSGKSLTLRLIAGLARPATGRVLLAGSVLTDTSARRQVSPQQRRIGMVFQDPALLPHRSALANVTLAVRDGDRRTRRRQASAWLRRVGADELADRRPTALSGGQKQRVALARSLAGQPRLLLLDEPLSALDQPVRRRLRGLVRELIDDLGLPALLVTHDREELVAMADRVVLADSGRLRSVASPEAAVAALDSPAP